jgi:ABC-type sugar transport system ATPase subunit
MNFFDGTIESRDQQLWFVEGGGSVRVPDELRTALEPLRGRPVVMGVRPEAMSDGTHARFAMGDYSLEMEVTLIQPLGDKMDVHLKTATHHHVVAQLASESPVALGDQVTIHLDPKRIHFFEPGENGKNLAVRTESIS